MPATRGPRTRVAPGLYVDALGYAAVVAVGSGATRRQREKRFPPGTKRRDMQAWQVAMRAALTATAPTKPAKGTLAADVAAYLPSIRSRACGVARTAELNAWVARFGPRPRHGLTTLELQQQLETWHAAKVAASTLNHRISSLVALYRALDGDDDATNPAARLRRYREPEPAPRALNYVDVEDLLTAMHDPSVADGVPAVSSATRACCRVLAYTGLPFVRLARLRDRPSAIDLEAKCVWLEGRRKGSGTAAKVMPLLDKGVEALRAWMAIGMPVPTSSTRTVVFARAVKTVNAARMAAQRPTLPKDVRPYDFRHTFATAVYAMTRDIRATADLLDCTEETAMRYARGALRGNVRAIVDGLNAAWS